MFFLSRPTSEMIARFLERQRAASLTYAPIGLSAQDPPGFAVDSYRDVVGHGPEAFRAATEALLSWRIFELGWAELHPRDTPVAEGVTVAVLASHLGFWSLNACRVVRCLTAPSTERGFAYGTLEDHAERGEELFTLSMDPADQSVWYAIRAVSRPRAALARVGYPISRWLQARFRRESAEALRRAVQEAIGRRHG